MNSRITIHFGLLYRGRVKGSGLSMMVELMSGPLVGSSYCDDTFNHDWGFFVLCFKPELLVDMEQFKLHASELRNIVRSQPGLKGQQNLRLPGDKGRSFAKEVMKRGYIEIDDAAAKLLGLGN